MVEQRSFFYIDLSPFHQNKKYVEVIFVPHVGEGWDDSDTYSWHGRLTNLSTVFSPGDGTDTDVVDRVGREEIEPGLHPSGQAVAVAATAAASASVQLVWEGLDVRYDRVSLKAAVFVQKAGYAFQLDLQKYKKNGTL